MKYIVRKRERGRGKEMSQTVRTRWASLIVTNPFRIENNNGIVADLGHASVGRRNIDGDGSRERSGYFSYYRDDGEDVVRWRRLVKECFPDAVRHFRYPPHTRFRAPRSCTAEGRSFHVVQVLVVGFSRVKEGTAWLRYQSYHTNEHTKSSCYFSKEAYFEF
jgi:hypothetical protein